MSMSANDDNIEIINGQPDARDQQGDDSDGSSLTDLVEQPAKVMMDDDEPAAGGGRAAPLDEASRNRLREIHATASSSSRTACAGARDKLERLTLPSPRTPRSSTPSCGSRRPDWSARSRACSTASRPRCSPSSRRSRATRAMRQGALPPASPCRGTTPTRRPRHGPVPVAEARCRSTVRLRRLRTTSSIRTQGASVEFPIFDAKSRSLEHSVLGKAGAPSDAPRPTCS